jgi:hypothetical protein
MSTVSRHWNLTSSEMYLTEEYSSNPKVANRLHIRSTEECADGQNEERSSTS